MVRKLVILSFLAFFSIAIGLNQSAHADEKGSSYSSKHANPCAMNPCSVKNPCGMKNPCSANPCGMKNPCSAKNPCAAAPKNIRKTAVRDMDVLMNTAEKLWNDPKLGTAGVSCATCHPDGMGLKAEPFPRHMKMANDILTLDQMINFCMTNPMKGKALQWNSTEMTALAAYVKAHTKEGDHEHKSCSTNPCGMKNPCSMKNPCGVNPCVMKNPCGKR